MVELDQVQMIVGSGMLGAAFSSECFLIHLLLTSSDYFTFGLVALRTMQIGEQKTKNKS